MSLQSKQSSLRGSLITKVKDGRGKNTNAFLIPSQIEIAQGWSNIWIPFRPFDSKSQDNVEEFGIEKKS